MLQNCDFVRFGRDGQSRRLEYVDETTSQDRKLPQPPKHAPTVRFRRRPRTGGKQDRVGDLMRLEPHVHPEKLGHRSIEAANKVLDAAALQREASAEYRSAQRRRSVRQSYSFISHVDRQAL